MVKLPYTVLNAFSSSADTGNPAAVVILPSPESAIDPADPFASYPSTPALQKVATELNYPMTAFLIPKGPKEDGSYLLRWLDPGTEVQLCGHATIALSHYLFSQPDAPARLDLTTVKHGQVISERLPNPLNKADVRVALDFPEILGFRDIEPSSKEWEDAARGLGQVARSQSLPIRQLRRNDHYLIVDLEGGFDMSAKGLPLDMEKLSHFEGSSILLTQPAPTAKDENGPHIHTRVLHALIGKKDEDAATGSAHCALIPHYLDSEAHRSTFDARCHELQTLSVVQQSAETGEMVVQWLKDRKKVRIFGNAVEISRGEVDVDMTG